MSFGYALKNFRDERSLSLRELGRLANIDHAYIHRLENDEKTAPSDEVVAQLIRNLKLTKRRAQILRFLVGKQISTSLIDLFIGDEHRPIDVFESLAQMSYRGSQPKTEEHWASEADRLEQFMSEQ